MSTPLGSGSLPAAQVPFQPLACTPGKSQFYSANWAGADDYTLNLNNATQQGVIDMVQGIFVDNSQNVNAVTFSFDGSSQNITIPAQSQAYMPVLAQNPVKIRITSTAAASQKTDFIVMNFRPHPYIWSV